jgi:hypothetical protein
MVRFGRRPRPVDFQELRRQAAGQGWPRTARVMRVSTSTLRRQACQKSSSDLRHPDVRMVEDFRRAEGVPQHEGFYGFSRFFKKI